MKKPLGASLVTAAASQLNVTGSPSCRRPTTAVAEATARTATAASRAATGARSRREAAAGVGVYQLTWKLVVSTRATTEPPERTSSVRPSAESASRAFQMFVSPPFHGRSMHTA
jgi:hypothetical protein